MIENNLTLGIILYWELFYIRNYFILGYLLVNNILYIKNNI
jgi:hypothetical protein